MIKNINTYKILILILLCLNIQSADRLYANVSVKHKTFICEDSSNIAVRKLNPIEQNKLLSNKDYHYDRDVRPPSISAWDRLMDWIARKFSKAADTKTGSYSLEFLKYILIAGAIFLVIFLLLKNDIRSLFYGKSATVNINFSEFEEDIHNINFDHLITEALENKDYRKAIRLHFLKILKDLTDKDLIKWQIDKTNNDYSIELKNNKYGPHFSELVRLYEYVWYGDFPITEKQFEETRIKFNKIDN